ncbi:HlyD family secretion protein [Ferrimonas aestuarii]|uniref:HlyD family efflux transporter periplasmic adaptor subunit n=1 Tax=Ferrimonas aestuarii TaxID=2569539 RepID=A0A4U1BM47_9GAMM|nr:HlyD family efflux transporter periplasmic adaptor subunit [Ferrimonas aestuarii]TKB54537.1 HlyD family efflux transporter periplasmic adaptor subunit [Ferrimonas aestuarii]
MKLLLPLCLLLTLIGCSDTTSSLALGTLERDRVTLTATDNQIVRARPVAEGSFVKAGQVLVQLDDLKQRSVVAGAEAQVAQAQAYLAKLTNGERPEDIAAAKAGLESADATWEEAQSSFKRTQSLVAQGLASQAELDRAKASRDGAKAAHDGAAETLAKLTRGSRIEDINQASAALEAAKAELKLQQQILTDLTVVATRDGIIDSLPYHVGERVPVNGIVAAIQADMAPFARVYVPEPYRVQLAKGSELWVQVDGIAQRFKGKVRWIATEPAFTPYYALNEQDRARLVYLAEIWLGEEAKSLPSGVPVQVEMPHD